MYLDAFQSIGVRGFCGKEQLSRVDKKGWFWRMLPRNKNSQRGYIRMFPRNENRNEGTFACSPGTRTGTRVRSPKPRFYETALLSPSEPKALPRLGIYVRTPRAHAPQWVRNRAGENRPGDIRPNRFVYTCVGTRVSTHVSTRVGAFVWDYNREKANFVGTLVYTLRIFWGYF